MQVFLAQGTVNKLSIQPILWRELAHTQQVAPTVVVAALLPELRRTGINTMAGGEEPMSLAFLINPSPFKHTQESYS